MTMNREEAIWWVNHLFEIRKEEYFNKGMMKDAKEVEEAQHMAIEALENKPTPCEKCIHVKSCRKVIILKNRTYKLIKYCSQGAERRKP